MTKASIIELLRRLGIAHSVHHHPQVRNAAEAAAAALDLDLSLLIKTLVFRTPDGWLLAVLRAGDHVAYGALAKTVAVERRRMRFATDQELRDIFGWEPGGAGPVTERSDVSVVVDESVFELPMMLVGGGSGEVTISAKPADVFDKASHRRACFVKRASDKARQ